jgi:nitrite reductase/ring-hydroxylating ferredoxin subunit
VTIATNAELRQMLNGFVGLPMPSNKDLTLGIAPRPKIRQEVQNRFPFPIPHGWFILAEAKDLEPGQVVPMHYFGRDLVLFRTETGEPRLLDAYCAHLGAHLGVGGKVEGACMVCPFHGWKYDGESGKCTEIPYTESDKVPTKAKVRSYPTLERNNMIWAWYHGKDGEPFYDVPVVPEFDDPDWVDPVCCDYYVSTSCQEMAENNHDFAHFKYVHGSPDIPWDDHVVEGPYKRTSGGGFVRESFGLGLGVLRVDGAFVFLSSTTPIDEENVHVRWTFCTPTANGPEAIEMISQAFLAGVSQDIPIWENKVYRDRPVLAKEEKGILVHREWAKQFYA